MRRNQFTFYRSFYEAMCCIKNKRLRGATYEMVAEYALNEGLPDPKTLTNSQKMALLFVLPVLDSGRKKAKFSLESAGKELEDVATLSKFDFLMERKAPNSHHKEEKEVEVEIDIETETELEREGAALDRGVGFDTFWNLYPKKVCKAQAREAFEKVTVPLETLLEAVRVQSRSVQWTRENGRYIPNPATWLGEKRWEDELPAPKEVKASGILGEVEREAIRRMMAQ